MTIDDFPIPDCAPGMEAWPIVSEDPENQYVCGPADPADPEHMDDPPVTAPEAVVVHTAAPVNPPAPATEAPMDVDPFVKVGLLVAITAHAIMRRLGKGRAL